jgi:uncharacterized radical SAM superfamily protein
MKFDEPCLLALYNTLFRELSGEALDLAPSFSAFCESMLNRVPSLTRVVIERTRSISVTGNQCEQNCAHCNGHYLQPMKGLNSGLCSLEEVDSLLISGGGNSHGEVSITPHLERLSALPARIKLNIHPGFQEPEQLLPLARRAVVSFDLPSCEEVIKKVYKLTHHVEDYQALYKRYLQHFYTVAHLTIGLVPNSLAGELARIDFLAKNHPKELVLIIFRATPKTEMAHFPEPKIGHVIEVLRHAKQKLNCPISLGCMRPAGRFRQYLDILFWMHGVSKIVMPHRRLLAVLEEFDVDIEIFRECCGLAGFSKTFKERSQ